MYLVIACIVYRIPDGPTCVGLIGTIIVETASFSYEAGVNTFRGNRIVGEEAARPARPRRRSGAPPRRV